MAYPPIPTVDAEGNFNGPAGVKINQRIDANVQAIAEPLVGRVEDAEAAATTAANTAATLVPRMTSVENSVGLGVGDPADATNANLISREDTETRTALNAAIEQHTFTVSIEDFNPDTDFAAALSAAIDAAENGGVVLFKPGKTYYTRAAVSKTDMNCRLRFNGARVLRAADAPSVPVLDLKYSITDVQAVTALTRQTYTFPGTSATTQVSRIEVADASAWQAGDVCKIVADDLIPWSVASQGEKVADTFEVLAVSGNYIYAPTLTRVPMTTNIRIGKMTDKRAVLEDVWIEDAPGSPAARNQPAVIIRAPVDLRLIRPKVHNLLAEGFQINSPFRSYVEEPDARNLRTSIAHNAWGYAVRENGPVDSKIIGGSGSKLRHVYTTGAYDSVPAHAELWRYGGAVNVVMRGGLADSVGHSAWDFHDEAIYGAIIDASTRFNHSQPEGSQMALKLRGKSHMVKGFTSHGPGGIVEEGRDGGGGHTIVNHVHTGIPGWKAGSVYQIRNTSSARLKSNYSGEVNWDEYGGELYRFFKADAHIPHLKVVARGVGTDVFRLFYVSDSRVEVDELTIDIRGSVGTGVTEPRLFVLADSLSEVIVHRLIVRASGVEWKLGDLGNGDGTVRIGQLVTDKLPAAWQGGFTNTGPSAKFSTASTILSGLDLDKGVEDRGNGNVTLTPFSYGTQRLTTDLTAARTVTEPVVGFPPGREITYLRKAGGAFPWAIGADSLTETGTWLRRRWDGTAWSTVARGNA